MRRPLSIALMMLAVSVVANARAGAGLFDRLAETFGGPVLVQSDGPNLAEPAPLVVPTAQETEESPPLPVPDDPAEPEPVPIELYPCVTYDDTDEIHPCAVEVIVAVPDPSSVKHPFYWLVGDAPQQCHCGSCASCLKPPAYVLICVPPDCPMPEPRVTHNGRRYTYHFGSYRVEVKLHRGHIEVEYND